MKKILFASLLLLPFAAEASPVPDCWSNFAHRRIKQGSYLLNFHKALLSEQALHELLSKAAQVNHMTAERPYHRLCQEGGMCVTVHLSPSHVTHYATIKREVESALAQIASHAGVSIDCVRRPR